MKKLLCALLLFTLTFTFISCGDKAEKAEYDGDGYSASVDGENAVLSLEANPTTGYTWIIDGETNVFEITEGDYISDDETGNLTGVGGTQQFNIKATAEGKASVPLTYARSWEKEDSAVETRYLTVEVEKNGSILQINDIQLTEEP